MTSSIDLSLGLGQSLARVSLSFTDQFSVHPTIANGNNHDNNILPLNSMFIYYIILFFILDNRCKFKLYYSKQQKTK